MQAEQFRPCPRDAFSRAKDLRTIYIRDLLPRLVQLFFAGIGKSQRRPG